MTLPAIDTIATFGGALTNYSPVEDPTTDRDAAAANQAYADTAAMTRTATRAWVRLVGVTTAAPVVDSCDSVWGSAAPTIARTGIGVFTVTWPATVTDELGASQALNLRVALAPNVEGATVARVQAARTAANVLTVWAFTFSAGSWVASDLSGITFTVAAI